MIEQDLAVEMIIVVLADVGMVLKISVDVVVLAVVHHHLEVIIEGEVVVKMTLFVGGTVMIIANVVVLVVVPHSLVGTERKHPVITEMIGYTTTEKLKKNNCCNYDGGFSMATFHQHILIIAKPRFMYSGTYCFMSVVLVNSYVATFRTMFEVKKTISP